MFPKALLIIEILLGQKFSKKRLSGSVCTGQARRPGFGSPAPTSDVQHSITHLQPQCWGGGDGQIAEACEPTSIPNQ